MCDVYVRSGLPGGKVGESADQTHRTLLVLGVVASLEGRLQRYWVVRLVHQNYRPLPKEWFFGRAIQ